MKYGEAFLHQFLGKQAVEQYLIPRRHIASRTGNDTIEAYIQDIRANDGEIPSGTQKYQMSLRAGLSDGLPHLRGRAGQRSHQCAVNIQKNQLSIHKITTC